MIMNRSMLLTLAALVASPAVYLAYFTRRIWWVLLRVLLARQMPSLSAENACYARCMATKLGLLSDTLAWHFLPMDCRFMCWLNTSLYKTFGLQLSKTELKVVAQTRAIDDLATRFAPKQLVVLGAGYDARPYRLRSLPQECKVWELDLPATQRCKKRELEHLKECAPDLNVRDMSQVRFLDVNFEKQPFMDKLRSTGFQANEASTLFTLEGVTSHLNKDEFINMLTAISNTCAPGTRLIFNAKPRYGRDLASVHAMSRALVGEPIRFQLFDGDELTKMFTEKSTGFHMAGFHVENVEEYQELVRKWVPEVAENSTNARKLKGFLVTLVV